MRVFAAALAFATSALAYTITKPDNATGFNNAGSNTVSWTRVSSDPQNFTIVLVNKVSEFPNYEQVLSALVDGGSSSGTIQVNPPADGWPSGSGFQINFAASAGQLNSLLVQSPQFSFHAPSGSVTLASSTSSASTASSGAAQASNTLTVPAAGSSPGAGAGSPSDSALNPNQSDTNTNPSGNGATTMGLQGLLFGLVALVGALLA